MLLDGKMLHTTNGTYDGNAPVGASRLTATLGAEWDTPFQPNQTLTARAVYNGSQYLDSANTLKVSPWTRLDVGARYTFKHNGTPVTLRATVANVLNKRYWMGITRGALVVGAPRTLTLSATIDF
jgi:iron complex outermembrane receptor protein